MKKILPYILIIIIIAQLFAPFTLGSGEKNNTVAVKVNTAEAMSVEDLGDISKDLRNKAIEDCLETTPTNPIKEACMQARASSTNGAVGVFVYIIGRDHFANDRYHLSLKIEDDLRNVFQSEDDAFPEDLIDNGLYNKFDLNHEAGYDGYSFIMNPIAGWVNLVKERTYKFTITLDKLASGAGGAGEVIDPVIIEDFNISDTSTQSLSKVASSNVVDMMPECNIAYSSTWSGCIGRTLYSLFFKPTSYLFAKTGQLLDFTVDYSTRDKSYRSAFVVEGWGVIRDFCNMFFIFVLLYIAFVTILNLNGVKTKEMIINVVIIGLLINFSLFTTQVIIDASNILTRVFYNSETIKVGPKDPITGVIQSETGPTGEIKLSEAIVGKINPQDLILNAVKVDNIPTKNGISEEQTETGIPAGPFILVTILASIINIVGLITFITCSLIFIIRVVGLWLAMILAPLAFFSYIVPSLQDMDMIGWKKWWPETLKLAFLAPVFVFFMYLIIKFLETGLGIADTLGANKDKMDFVLGIFVPFIFIMILLMKAKDVAVKMSGKMGEMASKAVSSVGSAVGGAGLAVATGGAALAMRGTIGAAGSAMKNSKWAQNMAGSDSKFASFIGNKSMDLGGKIGSKAFDVRNTSLGKAAGKGMGVDMGKAAEGGFDGAKKRQMEKDQKRAKELEPGQNSQEKKDLNKAQETLKDLENKNNRDIEPQQVVVDTAQQNWNMANSEYMADKTDPIKKQNLDDAKRNLDQEKDKMFAIKNGGYNTDTGLYRTTNGNISQKAIDKANTDFNAADRERTSAITSQGNANTALIAALDAMNLALGKVTDAKNNLAQAKTATKDAADYATTHPDDTAAAISHTNALTIQAAAQTEMDKVDTGVKTTTAAHATSTTTKDEADVRATDASTKYNKAGTVKAETIRDLAAAMAPGGGGVGESISEIKKGSLRTAQNAYDIKANDNKNNFADNMTAGSSKFLNVLTNLGSYSPAGADEAAHNIRMDVKTDPK